MMSKEDTGSGTDASMPLPAQSSARKGHSYPREEIFNGDSILIERCSRLNSRKRWIQKNKGGAMGGSRCETCEYSY